MKNEVLVCDSYIGLPKGLRLAIESKGNIFYSEAYQKNVIEREQRLLYIYSNRFILVVRVKKQYFLKAAILDSEPYRIIESSLEEEKLFLATALKLIKKNGVQWVISTNTARFQTYPTGSIYIPFGNHIIDLSLSEDDLWTNVHSKHRNSIRRGEKSNIEIVIGGEELIEKYVPLATTTMSRSGKTSGTNSYYHSIIKGLGSKAIIMLAYKDNVPQAGAIFIYNLGIAYYLHGASINRPEPGSANFLLWTAILYFKNIGVKEFSFVGYRYAVKPGSKYEGIQRFKERFGGQLEKSYLFRYVLNRFMYQFYILAMTILSKKPFSRYYDVIDEVIRDSKELNIEIK